MELLCSSSPLHFPPRFSPHFHFSFPNSAFFGLSASNFPNSSSIPLSSSVKTPNFKKKPQFFPLHFHFSSPNSSNSGLTSSNSPNFSSLKASNFKKKPQFFQISAIFERFTERAIKAVVFSQKEARFLGKNMVFTQHLLLGLIAEDRGRNGFLGSGIKIDKAREVVRSIWSENLNAFDESKGEISFSTAVPFSISTKRVFEAAVEYSKTMGYNFVAPEHLVIGLFNVDDGSAGRVLLRLGVEIDTLIALAVNRLHGELAKDGREPSSSSVKKMPFRLPERRGKTALSRFCVDLTARAIEGRIDPLIGRENEVQRVIEILARRTKNNPILLGEAGVGKTAIAEGVAISIAQAEAPIFLLNKRVMSLDIGLLLAGAKERGELEARVTALLSETIKSGDVILFIDEVHTLIGSGNVGRGKSSGLDISNLLKPALGRGELQCIASTTMGEYRSQFEKDKALARRFQPVWINEPSQEDAVKILLGLREKYEAHHKCCYTLEALNAAVQLSARYIPDRYLPDKAIDLIDEAGSRARMEAFKMKIEKQTRILSTSPDVYWQEIRAIQAMHEEIMASRMICDDAGASELILESPLPSVSEFEERTVVGPEDIAAVASVWSGIPLQQLTTDETMLLVGLEEHLKKRVVGQDEAVAAISRAVKRSRVGFKDPKRPIATMLFCGPTGVGKTELAKAVAESYFGSEHAMVRLDMSEYMERHTVSKLIGSPPGYIGFEEGGMLTEAIRKRPFTLLLLDEIEKAHPDVLNILLQLFEDGHLTDSQGRKVSFKNALIVMTSNVGSTAIANPSRATSRADIKALIVDELKKRFRPELLNRIDELVVFHPLKKKQILEILEIMLQDLRKKLISLGIGLEVTNAIKKVVSQEGYSHTYGARSLRRAVTSFLEDPLSEALLSGDYVPGETAVLDVDSEGKPVVIRRSDQDMNVSDKTSIQGV